MEQRTTDDTHLCVPAPRDRGRITTSKCVHASICTACSQWTRHTPRCDETTCAIQTIRCLICRRKRCAKCYEIVTSSATSINLRERCTYGLFRPADQHHDRRRQSQVRCHDERKPSWNTDSSMGPLFNALSEKPSLCYM